MQARRSSLTWGDSIRNKVLGGGGDGGGAAADAMFDKEPTSPLPTSALLSQPIPFRRTFSDQVSGSPSKQRRFPMGGTNTGEDGGISTAVGASTAAGTNNVAGTSSGTVISHRQPCRIDVIGTIWKYPSTIEYRF